MFGEPTPTPLDLHFRAFGIPVRVHPLFWLVTLLLGWSENLQQVVIWVGAVFFSIVAHELGHAFCARAFGYDPWIVLYGGGGLAMYVPIWQHSRWERIAISFCGPLAGFLVAGVVLGGVTWLGWPGSPILKSFLYDLLVINFFWSLFNLLPVWPMDGGQISLNLLAWFSPRQGPQIARWISVVIAGVGMAFWFSHGETYLAILFGYFLVMNLQGWGLHS